MLINQIHVVVGRPGFAKNNSRVVINSCSHGSVLEIKELSLISCYDIINFIVCELLHDSLIAITIQVEDLQNFMMIDPL